MGLLTALNTPPLSGGIVPLLLIRQCVLCVLLTGQFVKFRISVGIIWSTIDYVTSVSGHSDMFG